MYATNGVRLGEPRTITLLCIEISQLALNFFNLSVDQISGVATATSRVHRKIRVVLFAGRDTIQTPWLLLSSGHRVLLWGHPRWAFCALVTN